MAGIKPTFITGATAKIRLNGKTLAFCQDFQCSVQVLTQTPKVLGKYEGDSVEPLGYLVSGSFSIIRYAKGIQEMNGKSLARGGFAGNPFGLAANDAGNGVGNWGTVWGGKQGDLAARNGIGNDGRAHEALDPSRFSTGTTFDIQIYQKVGGPVAQTAESEVRDITSVLSGSSLAELAMGQTVDQLGILNIRNARITQADFSLNKRSAAQERFTFVALYVDGDGFVANSSGTF